MATKKAAKKTAASPEKTAAKAAKKTAAKKTVSASKPKPAEPRAPATHHEIAVLAERLWNERGRPDGSPHIDWHEAERQLKG